MKKKNLFTVLSEKAAHYSGHPATFVTAFFIVIIWGLSGPIFNFNDTWQLVINTGTTIITFLMVFLIQSTQNRDTMALQLKLDELIRVMPGAQEVLLDLEELSEDKLKHIRNQYEEIARRARADIQREIGKNGDKNIFPLDVKSVCEDQKDLA